MSCIDITTIEIESIIGSNISIEQSNSTIIEISTPSDIQLEVSHCVSLLPTESIELIDSRINNDLIAGTGIIFDYDLPQIKININKETVEDTVDQLLKAGSYISLQYIDSSGSLTIAATGLQPSGNYSVVGHTHITSDITNFASGVSGLLPSVSGSGYATSNFSNNIYTISVTGLQPSGNYSVVGHTHTSSQITDFNSSVSGLIPPSNFTSLSGISGITVSNSGTNYIVGLTDPTIQLADITDLSSNARNFLLTPSSNNLSSLVSNETGSGFLVFNNSPALSGTPTVPTAPSGTNTDQIASTQFVRTEITNLVDSAPITLDTLNELAAALGDDPNFATTITNSLAGKANLSGAIFTGSVSIPSGTGNFNSLTINNINVSVSGHSHVASDITNFNSSVSGLLPSVTGIGYATSSFTNNIYTISVTGLQPSGNYASSVHTHLSSDITNFNSSVSGLLPVKDIVGGSGINVSSVSGTYTVAITGISGLIGEEVDDRVSQLLVAGTGVSLTYDDPSGTLTIDNLHSEINILSQEPQGFVNRTDSIISFNDSTRTFTIQPAVSGGSYAIYAEGIKVIKSGVETVVLNSGTALNYLHFDTTPPYTLHTKTTGFNFDTDIPISFIHWNSDINQSTFFGEERHGIRMDSVTHKWIHNTFGMQYISGLSIGGYTLLGNGSSNSHAQIDISDGVLYQEDIIINITNGINGAGFVQQLSPIAYIPTYYHSGSTGQWVRGSATAFPLKYNATRAQYNLYSGGTWTTPNVSDKKYFAMWIVATNDINDPILAIVGQREDSSLSSAENYNNWNDVNLTNIPTQEIRPLYRLIFTTDDTFTNTPKSSLQSILDIRVAVQSIVAGVAQNDHGILFGLADDDHSQYVHIDNNRTISAIHTFSNGLNSSGLINSTSGNFSSLTVNSTGVSLLGHTHNTSDITNFTSGVSGLLPSVSGSGYALSSFTNNVYTISVTGLQPSGNYSVVGHTHLISDISNINGDRGDIFVSSSGLDWQLKSESVTTETLASGLIIDCGLLFSPFVTTDPYFAQVNILAHFNNTNNSTTFTDSSSFSRTLTRTGSNAVISTTRSKFGGSSLYLGGVAGQNQHYVSTFDAISGIGIQDYVFEGWFYFSSLTGSTKDLFALRLGNLYVSTDQNKLAILFGTPGFGGSAVLAATASLLVNTWHHIALVRRYNNSIVLYCDGIATINVTSTYLSYINENVGLSNIYIGGGQIPYYRDKDFYIDDFRFTVGQARYTGNFTPPTTQFEDS